MDAKIASIQPTENRRVIDLVEAAGHDVSDWSNYKNGKDNPAANPRHCYKWAFSQEGQPSILCLWFHNMRTTGDLVWQALNQRQAAVRTEGARRKRAENFDQAVQSAWQLKEPLRVIVCVGGPHSNNEAIVSRRVQGRLLDPQPWHVAFYDRATGEMRLVRGSAPPPFVDQHDLHAQEGLDTEVPRREVSGSVFQRSAEVRRQVLARASGHCEFCSKAGFRMSNGSVYLETHHIVPLHQKGLDNPHNVIALCADHHREAHYGERAGELAEAFLKRLRESV